MQYSPLRMCPGSRPGADEWFRTVPLIDSLDEPAREAGAGEDVLGAGTRDPRCRATKTVKATGNAQTG
jgi:hypothetical protein